jgi:hypothetical protein
MANYGEVPAGGLNAYYHFDGDANDYSGNARNLSLSGSTGYSTSISKVGTQSLYVSGATAGANLANTGGVADTYSPRTILMWFMMTANPPTTGDKRCFIWGRWTQSKSVDDLMYTYVSPGVFTLSWRFITWAIYQYTHTITLTLNQWYHSGYVYPGTGQAHRCFLNGQYVGGSTPSGVAWSGGASNIYAANGTDAAIGYRDEYIITSAVWTDAQVRQHYALGRGLLCPRMS